MRWMLLAAVLTAIVCALPAHAGDDKDAVIAELRSRAAMLQAEKDALDKENERLKHEVKHLREAHNQASANLQRATRAVDMLTNSLNATRDMAAAQEQQVVKLTDALRAAETAHTTDVANLQASLQQQTDRANHAVIELTEKQAAWAKAAEKYEAAIHAFKTQGELQRELHAEERKHADARRGKDDEIAKLRKRLSNLDSDLERAKREREKLTGENERAAKRNAEMRRRAGLGDEGVESKAVLRARMAKLKAENDQLRDRVKALMVRIESVTGPFPKDTAAVRSLVAALRSESKALRIELAVERAKRAKAEAALADVRKALK